MTSSITESSAGADSASFVKPRFIGDALRGHSNSLGFVRLLLASLVIFDHAFPLGGYGPDVLDKLTEGQASLGSIAVSGFFVISGYLITKSAMSADILQYMWRRVLRIFPAYWTVLILTAVVIAPAVWVIQGQALTRYFNFGPQGPVHYFTSNWTLRIGTYGIYNLLQSTTPYGRSTGASVFNGSIWTLIYEWSCYLLIGGLLLFGILKRARFVVPIVTVFLFIVQIAYSISPTQVMRLVPWLSDPYTISLTLTFMFGACIAVYSKQIPFSDGLGVASGLLMLYTLKDGGFATIGIAAAAYFVLYLGARLPKPFRRIGAKNDYSYGVYIYGFVVEQVLAWAGLYKAGYAVFSIVSLVISLGMAWLSWHIVEKRAMSLKDWGPGRGWRYWWSWLGEHRRPNRAKQGVAEPAAHGPEQQTIADGTAQ